MFELKFDQEQCEAAYNDWGCNCGPSALAAALGVTLDRAHELIPEFDSRRYTSPSMMKDALQAAEVPMREITRRRRIEPDAFPEVLPISGLVRIQWTGPWTDPGANPRWAYRQTHWVASKLWDQHWLVFDCNGGLRSFGSWKDEIAPALSASVPRGYGGWFATHLWELAGN
mgnify:CR=1 FL=1